MLVPALVALDLPAAVAVLRWRYRRAMPIPLSEWSGSGATERLRETLSAYNERAEEQTAEMVRLTRWIARLTWAMVALVVAQIVIAVVALIVAG